MHPCEILYKIAGKDVEYGIQSGICRVTGQISTGVNFDKWVKDTFTNFDFLHPGDIISNEALFCFDEKSKIIQEKTGKEKEQKFRSYSHFVHNAKWHILTKADKSKMYKLLLDDPEIAVISDSGQRHLFFKHRLGFWQFEDHFITPDKEGLQAITDIAGQLYHSGFSKEEIETGNYSQYKIKKAGMKLWIELERQLRPHRGTKLFSLSIWLLQ